ncbi:hypothetical protein QOT17_018272 [Balamuthia mandrillaris]
MIFLNLQVITSKDFSRLYKGRVDVGDVFSIFDSPPGMWLLEAEDNFEKNHKIFPESNSSKAQRIGEPSIVTSRESFQQRMRVFSQGQLEGLNWDNVLVLGGAVVACLLPTAGTAEKESADSKDALVRHFNQLFGEDSDVDLCLYGITDVELLASKLVEIHEAIVAAIPDVPVSVVSSGESITFLRHYPYWPIQLMGTFHSVAEVLHGIDLDCTAVAYDGRDVWTLPRAWMAFNRRWNLSHGFTKDIYGVRGCPHYEQRLLKYSKRGFAVVEPSFPRFGVGQWDIPQGVLEEPDYSRQFKWVYSGYDMEETRDCYPAVGLRLLLLCEAYPRTREVLMSLKPVVSIPYGKDWPAQRVTQHLRLHQREDPWELPSEKDEWKAEFNHFDGYTRYHQPPSLELSGTEEPKERERTLRRCVKERLHLMANHAPFLVPYWLQGLKDESEDSDWFLFEDAGSQDAIDSEEDDEEACDKQDVPS